jgi:phosphonatase-like hydrolase
MMRIELVVFDMAGTTVYDGNAVSNCFRAAFAAAGLEVDPAAVNRVMGLPKPEAIRRLVESSPLCVTLRERVPAIHEDFVARMRHYYASDPSIHEVPGASETFAVLRQAGIKCTLNTGFSRAIASVLITRLGWQDCINASVTSDEVARGRPHPDMIHYLMKEFCITSAMHVAKVGDTPVDLEEGANAGCGMVIGVTRGSNTREQLAQWPHTHLIDSVADLPELLGLRSGCDTVSRKGRATQDE